MCHDDNENASVINPQPKKDYMDTPTVLITGALTGIGRATALAFAQEGARVVVSGRHDDAGQKLATELRKLGTEAEFVRTDVRQEEEVKNLVDQTIARFGRLDIAVNNAGTEGTPGFGCRCNHRELSSHLRHQCAWCASEHEIRDSGYASPRQREHR